MLTAGSAPRRTDRRSAPAAGTGICQSAVAGALICLPLLLASGEAHAQVAATVSLVSNDMFRGESLSRDDPAAGLAISFDGPGGLFAGASATVAAGANAPRITSAIQYAGIAHRAGGTSFEAGLIHRTYAEVVDLDYRRDFVEGFVGVSRGPLVMRLYVSPDYLRDGPATYYLDLNAQLWRHGAWRLDGHGGLSLIPSERDPGRRVVEAFHDWRLQLSRTAGRVVIAGGLSTTNYPVYSASGRVRFFSSVAFAF